MHEASGPDGTPDAVFARRRSGAWAAAGLIVVVMLAYAWWAVSLPPFSGSANAAVLLPGMGAVVVGTARRRPEQPQQPRPRTGAWFGLAAAACLWELLAYVQQPRSDHPTLSSLANALLGSQPLRAAAFFLWLLAALELARR